MDSLGSKTAGMLERQTAPEIRARMFRDLFVPNRFEPELIFGMLSKSSAGGAMR
jgi:hypothetical protein